MSYTPTTELMVSLGFSSEEKDKSLYRVWTNLTSTQQIRIHRSSGSIWFDFYERIDTISPWRKRLSGPSLPTQEEFYRQLLELSWLSLPLLKVG